MPNNNTSHKVDNKKRLRSAPRSAQRKHPSRPERECNNGYTPMDDVLAAPVVDGLTDEEEIEHRVLYSNARFEDEQYAYALELFEQPDEDIDCYED